MRKFLLAAAAVAGFAAVSTAQPASAQRYDGYGYRPYPVEYGDWRRHEERERWERMRRHDEWRRWHWEREHAYRGW